MTQPSPLYPDKIFPDGFLQLCSDDISGLVECTVLFLHTLLLEVGFIPKDVDEYDVYQRMPENWRGNHAYNIIYYHKSIPDIYCCVTCVRLYSSLVIYGVLEDETDEKNTVFLRIKVIDPLSLSCDTNKLALKIKDEFCFRLLALIQERVNFKPSFGLGGLVDDCKHAILKYLNVESVIAVSKVNKDFHAQANSQHLWKYLFARDFNSDVSSPENSSSTENWKKKYKEEYVKKRIRTPVLPFNPYDSPLVTVYPPLRGPRFFNEERSLDNYLDRHLQEAFPNLRDRFRSLPYFRPFGNPPRRHDPFNPWFF